MRLRGFFAVLALAVLGTASGITERIDLWLLDSGFAALKRWVPRSAGQEVAVVGIDQKSVDALPEPIALWHRHLARFLAQMALAEPAAVGIDLVLPQRSFDRVQPGADAALTRALAEARRAYPLVLALTISESGSVRPLHKPFLTAAGPDGTGHALFPVDEDGAVRRFDNRVLEPTFAGQIARRLGAPATRGYLDYARGEAFAYSAFADVLEWDRERLQQAFRGKPVLLGVVLPYTDDQRAPVQLAAWDTRSREVFGVLLHAQALRNLLGEGLVQRAPVIVVAALAALAAALWFLPASAAIGTVLVLPALSVWLLARGWFLPVAPIMLAALLAVGVREGLSMAAQLAERRRLRASFRGYVSPGVMDEILAGRISPDAGGVRRFVCVMFADIRGYTARAQAMRPEEVIRFLNRYFERVVALVHARGGTVVSIMGDGIMIAFGTPKVLDNPCREAFACAREMLEFVEELNASLALEGAAPIAIGIGLNAGEALCGHVGSPERHEYSAIGDVTNVASRLQTLTKEQGYRVLASAAVAELLPERPLLQPLGAVPVKGHAPVELYGYSKVVTP